MDSIKQGIILLIKSALTGESYALPEGFSWEDAESLIKKNNAFQLCFTGAVNCGITENIANFDYLQDQYCVRYVRSELQMEQVDRVCQAFEKKGIQYMPVKGSLMKKLYPSHELRTMGDADILIQESQYPQIREIMIELGYEEKIDSSDYDYTWIHPNLHIELHKHLFSSYFSDYARYFGDIWSRATNIGGNRWALRDEDLFVYYFTHFVKHFRFGGIGCNHATDLWVYKHTHPDLDENYILKQMEVLSMGAFYKNVCRLLSAWFENGSWDDITEKISELLFGGTWGTRENYEIAQSIKIMQEENVDIAGSRKKQIKKLLFPTKDELTLSHPKLAKLPLPIAWVARGMNVLIYRRKTIQHQHKILTGHSDDKITQRKEEMETIGLRFSK